MKTKKQIESEGFEVNFTNGSGAGGQKRNRTLSVAVVKHIGSGIVKRNDETRTANKNMNLAYELILSELKEDKAAKYHDQLNERRNEALAKGTIRAYDFKRGICKNHLTGKEASLKKVLNGRIENIS